MEPRRTPGTSWLGRLLRGWRPDRNPLRRRSDRIELAILSLLVVTFLAGTPVAWHSAGSWAYAVYTREAQLQQAVLRQVPATQLQTAPGWDASIPGGAYVIVRWKAPDGQVRTGPVFVPNGTGDGTVSVWIDRAGQLTDPPLRQAQVEVRARLSGMLAVLVVAVTLFVAGLLTRRALDRRRLAGWDADWLANGPRWSPRQ